MIAMLLINLKIGPCDIAPLKLLAMSSISLKCVEKAFQLQVFKNRILNFRVFKDSRTLVAMQTNLAK